MQEVGLIIEVCQVYPLPGSTPNSVWGCLVVSQEDVSHKNVGGHQLCQQVLPTLFIPEKSRLVPRLTPEEKSRLFSDAVHIFHPEIGLANLGKPIQFETLIKAPTERDSLSRTPEPSAFIPRDISLYQVIPVTKEDVLSQLEEVVGVSDVSDQPLDFVEKIRLKLYEMLLSEEGGSQLDLRKMSLIKKIEKSLGTERGDGKNWSVRMQEDFEDLETRNNKEIDKLLDMLKKNPEEGLKYAVPLDNEGLSRGDNFGSGSFTLGKIWNSLTLTSQTHGIGNGGSSIAESHFQKLREQYHKMAKDLITKGEYEKAAFVYLKLLKQHWNAAQTLEEGHHYAKAATIYLEYCKNKEKAAECLEKGNMIREAIPLYRDLKEYEKIGDLHLQLKQESEAKKAYVTAKDLHLGKGRYIEASTILNNKMNLAAEAREVLLIGWQRKQKSDCLSLYFQYAENEEMLKQSIKQVREGLSSSNSRAFLKVLRKEQKRNQDLKKYVLQTAYSVIAEYAKHDKRIVGMLRSFIPADPDLQNDISRFSTKR